MCSLQAGTDLEGRNNELDSLLQLYKDYFDLSLRQRRDSTHGQARQCPPQGKKLANLVAFSRFILPSDGKYDMQVSLAPRIVSSPVKVARLCGLHTMPRANIRDTLFLAAILRKEIFLTGSRYPFPPSKFEDNQKTPGATSS